MAKFLVYLEPSEEGGYIVSCPQLPGCVTQDETADEALAMINGVAAIINPAACDYSSACQEICPTQAISLTYELIF